MKINQFPSWLQPIAWLVTTVAGAIGFYANAFGILDLAKQHPLRAGGLFFLYILFSSSPTIIGKIAEFVNKRKTPSAQIQPIDATEDSPYRETYLNYLVDKCGYAEVEGFDKRGPYSLELNQVFVPLQISPTAPGKAERRTLAENLGSIQDKEIWEHLESKLNEPTFARRKNCPRFLIIGPPGYGKTTLLKNMILVLADGKQPSKLPKWLPILLFFREKKIADALKENPQMPLGQAIQQSHGQLPVPPKDFFENLLNGGKCIVLLDGLDEVQHETRAIVVKWVKEIINAHKECAFIITSRPHASNDNPFEGFTVLEVKPFTNKQAKTFLGKWYTAQEIRSEGKDDQDVRVQAQAKADNLWERLVQKPSLEAMARNPLLLTMIANIHNFYHKLPDQRSELYAEIFKMFLGKRKEAIGIAPFLPPAESQRVLQALAYYMMEKELSRISITEAKGIIQPLLSQLSQPIDGRTFLDEVEKNTGLLLEVANDVYEFAHRSFGEFLAAVYVKEHHLEDKLINQIGNDWWSETIILYATQEGGNINKVFSACLSSNSATALQIAGEIKDEVTR